MWRFRASVVSDKNEVLGNATRCTAIISTRPNKIKEPLSVDGVSDTAKTWSSSLAKTLREVVTVCEGLIEW